MLSYTIYFVCTNTQCYLYVNYVQYFLVCIYNELREYISLSHGTMELSSILLPLYILNTFSTVKYG